MRRIFIVNPQAGQGKGLRCGMKIEESVEKREIEGDIVYTKKPGDEIVLAKKAVSERYDCLISVGGEGTNNGVASGMAGSDALFGMVRAGMTNDITSFFEIPKDTEGALEVIRQGKAIPVDLVKVSGRVNERICLSEVSFGFSANLIQVFEDFKKRYPRILPSFGLYLVTTLKLLLSPLEYPEVEIAIPGLAVIRKRVTLVLIANGPNGGGFKLAPQADPADGASEICLIGEVSKGKILRNLANVRQGTHLTLPEVWTLPDGSLPRVSSLIISSSQPLPCEIDGDPLEAEKEYKITILPKALNVIVPPGLAPQLVKYEPTEVKVPEVQPV